MHPLKESNSRTPKENCIATPTSHLNVKNYKLFEFNLQQTFRFVSFARSGSQYWVFKDTMAMIGYPRPISEWGMRTESGAPVVTVEAAFIWAHNGKTYLFSGGRFWRFDESLSGQRVTRQLEPGYPKNNTLWGGVPSHMDDIISWGEGNMVFRGIHKRAFSSSCAEVNTF